MSNSVLANSVDYCQSFYSSDKKHSVKLEISGSTFYEYVDGELRKDITFPDPEMGLILVDLKIQELDGNSYIHAPFPYSVTVKKTETSSFDVFGARMALFKNEDSSNLFLEQLDSLKEQRLAIIDNDEVEVSFDDIIDDEYIYGIVGENDELYVWLSDLDVVSLCDGLSYYCKDSGIKELDVHYEKLNGAHITELRKLFHNPICEKLSFLNISCGYDSISAVFEILKQANGLHVPVSLAFFPEIQMPAPQKVDGSIIHNANLRYLSCALKDVRLFTNEFNKLKSLTLSVPIDNERQNQIENEVITLLSENTFQQLEYICLNNVFNENYLERLLNLSLIKQLKYLKLMVNYADFPYKTLLKYKDKWSHIEGLYLNGHLVDDDIIESFKPFSQVTFLFHNVYDIGY